MSKSRKRSLPRSRAPEPTDGARGLHRREILISVALAISILLVYGRLVGAGFVNYDDPLYVLKNTHVQEGLSLDGLIYAFTTGDTGNWHPLTWLSHMLVCQIFGLDAAAHHMASVVLHIVNAILLFLVLGRMTGSEGRSAVVAGLFALHPLHVESVAWIAERKDVLSTTFWLLAMAAYLGYCRRPGRVRYGLVAISLAAGLMAKPMLVTLPLVLLLLDLWPLGRFARYSSLALLIEKLPLLALSVISSAITYFFQKRSGSIESSQLFPPGDRVANALLSYCVYLRKTVWPSDLAVFYARPRSYETWRVAAAAVLLTGLSVAAIRLVRTRPYVTVGWFWFLGTLVPTIGLIPVGLQAMADRYTYIPLIGIFILIAWGVPDILRAGERNAALPIERVTGTTVSPEGRTRITRGVALCAALAAIALAASAVVSWFQLRHWRDSIALWSHAIAVTADPYVAHRNLGLALAELGRDAEAAEQYAEAIRINPDYLKARSALALLRDKEGRLDEAMAQYREITRVNPADAGAQNDLGSALDRSGRTAEAVQAYTAALAADPGFATAHYNLGLALFKLGRATEAIEQYRAAGRLGTDTAELHNNLGVALLNVRKPADALDEFRAAVRLQPDKVKTVGYLAWLLATGADPSLRNGVEAVELARRACDLTKSQDPVLLDTLAAAYAEQGRFDLAVRTAQDALALAVSSGKTDLAGGIQRRLELYRAGRPFHQSD